MMGALSTPRRLRRRLLRVACLNYIAALPPERPPPATGHPMLSTIRAFAKTWFATVLIAGLIVSFAAWGVGTSLHGKISNSVITAGSRELSGPTFKRIFMGELQRAEQQQGQPLSLTDAVAQGADTVILSGLAANEAYLEFLKRLGVTATQSEVGDEISKQPLFFDKVTGKFDNATYQEVLRNNDFTSEQFLAGVRDDIAQEQFNGAMAAGVQSPKTYAALFAVVKGETRDLSLFVIDQTAVPMPAPPTDAQLQTIINQNAAKLTRPETRQLTVVRASAKAIAASMPVDPAALQKLYAARKDAASTPEQRSFVIIPVKDAAAAATTAAKLRGGADPAAVAKALGVDPISYSNSVQSAVADPNFATAAFALKPGEVSGPVQGALGAGLAVIKLSDIKPAHSATFDEMRPQLETQLRTEASEKQAYDLMQKFTAAQAAGADLAKAAAAAGVAPQSIGPVDANGASANGPPAAALSPKLLHDAFKLAAGGQTGVETDARGEYFVVRVDNILPPAVRSLAELKPQLIQYYMGTEISKRLSAKADELTARIRKGETLEAVAASVSAKVQHATGITRDSLQQNRAISPELGDHIFTSKKGDVFSGATGQVDFMIARLDADNAPAPAQAAAATMQIIPAFSQQLAQNMVSQLRDVAKAQIKPVTDASMARQALGLSADSAGKAAGQPLGAPGS